MSLSDEKRKIIDCISHFKNLDYILSNDEVQAQLKDLQNDIENDFFTVVVLGEFKRGKSTFINALLGVDFLPVDILPETATINAISYNDVPKVQIVYKNDTVEDGSATLEFLRQFSARKNNYQNIKYIKIGWPSEMLQGNIVIVDTPGVDDVNEHRSEITYGFVPKAHAVLFILDAKSPLKLSEKEFIENKLLNLKIDNIIFLLNKYDSVDDEEEDETEYLSDLKLRLEKTFDLKKDTVRLYPLSAKWALEGMLNNKPNLVELSGINIVKNAIKDTVFNGAVEQSKVFHYKRRLKDIFTNVLLSLQNDLVLKNSSMGELLQAKSDIQKLLEEQSSDRKNLGKFIEYEKINMYSMVDKSVTYFYRKLEEDIVDNIELYKGSDFKEYVEQRVSKSLRREIETWIMSYSPCIDQLINAVEKEISLALSTKFKQRIVLRVNNKQNIATNGYSFNFNVNDVSEATSKAGLIAAGGAGLLMAIGAPILMPFISMAAYPMLQKKFLAEELAEAKYKILPDVKEQVAHHMKKLQDEIHNYIDRRINDVLLHSEESYFYLLKQIENQFNIEISLKDKACDNVKSEMDIINKRIDFINNMLEEEWLK